jgi:hypothetical protein
MEVFTLWTLGKKMRLIIPEDILHKEGKIQHLLIKAEKTIKDYELSDLKWVREYQEAIVQYVEEVMKMVPVSLALKLDIDPSKVMKKSFEVPIDVLVKAARGDHIEFPLFYKSLFTKLKDKFSVAKRFFKKFGFNMGKPLEPFNFKNRFTYNPETGKPLTNKQWDGITDDVVDFLGDKIGNLEEELVVRAGLMGKLMQHMEEEGIPIEKQKDMSWNDVNKKYKVPMDVEEAEEEFDVGSITKKAIEYSKAHAAEFLSIEDGSLKNKIVSMVKDQITGGLEDGVSTSEMISRLFWIDPTDSLGARFKDKTIDAINRDWRRIAISEFGYAKSNGYLAAVRDFDKKKKENTYVVFAGRYNPQEKPDESCNKWLGTVMKVVDKPLADDRIDDKYAKYATWIGKNNVGRSMKNWWVCVLLHPNCTHRYDKFNPETEEWDDDVKKIVFKVD